MSDDDGLVYLTAEAWVRFNELLAEPPAALPGLRDLVERTRGYWVD